MDNGKWIMQNGELRMENGQCKIYKLEDRKVVFIYRLNIFNNNANFGHFKKAKKYRPLRFGCTFFNAFFSLKFAVVS